MTDPAGDFGDVDGFGDVDDFGDELVPPDAPGLPERFFDRFVFNLHAMDGRAPSILFGAGIHPPRDTADGFAVLVTPTEQRNLRFSTELSATDGSSIGPFSWQLLEPMTSWQVTLGANPTGLEFDLTWRRRAPAWFGDVNVSSGDTTTAAFAHLFQSGRYRGRLSVDGVELDVDGWVGQRDRSRGVRTMSGGQGLHLWVQMQFPAFSVGFLHVEDRAQGRLLLEGAVMHEDGTLDPVLDVRHDLDFDAGLDLRGGRFVVTTAADRRYVVEANASARGGYMAGAGYGGHHGRPMGRDHVEHDVYPLDGTVSPRTLDSALVDRLSTFACDGEAGSGILEFAHSRSNSYRYRPTT